MESLAGTEAGHTFVGTAWGAGSAGIAGIAVVGTSTPSALELFGTSSGLCGPLG